MRVPRGKCRNEGRPIQGIDTIRSSILPLLLQRVEMRVAPFRALTQKNFQGFKLQFSVEMRVAPFRALTHES